ncbi:MAG: DNA/RNA non-specific endonuclease [Bryobacteraceae bacterium]
MKIFALLFAALQILTAQPARFGLPACSSSHSELADRTYFVLCHDSALHVPSWTAYELLPSQLGGTSARPKHFRQDPELTGAARNSDYRNSGLSRGHMVPAEDMAWSDDSIRATFVLSNAVPQVQRANGGVWLAIENAVRRLAAQSDVVYVFTGPIFAATKVQYIGEGLVAVPTHTFKVVLAIRGNEKIMFAAIVPNAAIEHAAPAGFAATVDEVERLTGLDFFAALDNDEEDRLESELHPVPWMTDNR